MMKKIALLLLNVCLSYAAYAQDIIVTKNGEALKVYNVEMGSETVFYQQSNESDAPTLRMAKSNILVIKYQDGRNIIMGEGSEQVTTNSTQTSAPTKVANKPVDANANKAAICAMKDVRVEYLGKPSNSEASMLFCQYLPKSDAELADQNVILSFKSEAEGHFSGKKNKPMAANALLYATVKNRTKKTLYIDLGNSFFVRGQESLPYYVPSMTSHTQGHSTGIGANVGGMTGLGGGIIGGGIGIGSTSSSSVTTTTVKQRVIAVPPMAEKTLEAVSLYPRDANIYDDDIKYAGTYRDLSLFIDKADMVKLGECRELGESCGIGAFSIVITYASDENISDPQTLSAPFSLQRLVGSKAGHAMDMKYFDVECISSNYKNTVHFFARQRKK